MYFSNKFQLDVHHNICLHSTRTDWNKYQHKAEYLAASIAISFYLCKGKYSNKNKLFSIIVHPPDNVHRPNAHSHQGHPFANLFE